MNNAPEIINKKHHDEKLWTPLNIFLAILLILQFPIYIFLSTLDNHHRNSGMSCSNAWDCKNCNGQTCECTVCEDGGFDCANPQKIKCPDKNNKTFDGTGTTSSSEIKY